MNNDNLAHDYATVEVVGTLHKKREGVTLRNNPFMVGSLRLCSETKTNYIPFCTFSHHIIDTLRNLETGTRVYAQGKLEQYRSLKNEEAVSFLQVKIEHLEPLLIP